MQKWYLFDIEGVLLYVALVVLRDAYIFIVRMDLIDDGSPWRTC